jgi:hypothetical protein
VREEHKSRRQQHPRRDVDEDARLRAARVGEENVFSTLCQSAAIVDG